MRRIRNTLKDITSYPAATVGLILIAILFAVAFYTIFSLPYNEAIRLWRGGEELWFDSPRTAEPIWMNWFRSKKLPETIKLTSEDESVVRQVEILSDTTTKITTVFTFDYPYDGFPQEINLFFKANYQDKAPFITLTWFTPDGREIRVADVSGDRAFSYRFAQDSKLQRRLDGLPPAQGLFADLTAEVPFLVRGTYKLQIDGLVFEQGSDYSATLILYGQVHGIAGTDHQRRDLMVALLWGIPVALTFGLLAAVGTTIMTMIIAAIGVWFGGWVDELIQRITEVNLILPVLPILIMIGTFYSRSLWIMLSATIVLFIFGGSIKTYRAVFLQVRESPYIEAAQAYGASNRRMIFRYLIPRIIPLMLPNFATLVPSFVFLEATLSVLGLGDPILPTWGKIISEARNNGALFKGQYYWMLEPAVLLSITGLAFAMVGYSLDRIFNPRLRGL